MLDYKFDPKAVYLVAVTYGPDSMALLDMMQNEGVKPVVCCVNYHVFSDASDSYAQLKAYCEAKGLPFEYLDCATLPESERYPEGADFSFWARRVRYDFFRSVYEKRGAEALFVAHQLDDVLEAYLLEKQGEIKRGKYGLSPVSEVEGMLVVRPLLAWTHNDLVSYDREHGIPYSEQSEIFEIEHTRGDLRKTVIAHLSAVEREAILNEMRAKKEGEFSLSKELGQRIDEGEELEIRALIALPRDEFASAVVRFCSHVSGHVALTPKSIDEIRAFLLSRKTNDAYPLGGNAYLIKEYDIVFLGKQWDTLPYTYTLEQPGELHTEQFDLDFSMGAEDRGIHAEDYPLTIRTALPSDSYVSHGFLQNVFRAFSVWKMPTKLRYIWPVFIDKNGKIIYVPRYARNFQEYHSSVLKLHLPEEE